MLGLRTPFRASESASSSPKFLNRTSIRFGDFLRLSVLLHERLGGLSTHNVLGFLRGGPHNRILVESDRSLCQQSADVPVFMAISFLANITPSNCAVVPIATAPEVCEKMFTPTYPYSSIRST